MIAKNRTLQLVLAGLVLLGSPAFAADPYECLYTEQVDHIDAKVDKYLDFYVKNGSGGPALVGAADCDKKSCHAIVYCRDVANGGNFVSNTYCHAIKDNDGKTICPSATRCANDTGIVSSPYVSLAPARTSNDSVPTDKTTKPATKVDVTK